MSNGNKNKNKWDLIKLRSFCIEKKTIKKIKRQPSEWEKIVASETTDKRLIYKKISSLYSSILGKQIAQSKNIEDLNGHFSEEDIQMANRHMKRCSISLIIREMQIKTTMRCHLTSTRIAITKNSTNNKC